MSAALRASFSLGEDDNAMSRLIRSSTELT
jgi:hypothetical protein